MTYPALDLDVTRGIVAFDLELARILLKGKACSADWGHYGQSATALKGSASGTSSIADAGTDLTLSKEEIEEEEVYEYPDRQPTNHDRNTAFIEMEAVWV